jgi:folate-binding protein YgfZ
VIQVSFCPYNPLSFLVYPVVFEDKKEDSSRLFKWNTTRDYLLGIGGIDGPETYNKIPLECNLDLLHYISYAKGCYVGQELIARTKYKGVIRKRLLPFYRFIPDATTSNPATSSECRFDELMDTQYSFQLNNTLSSLKAEKDGNLAIGDKIFLVSDLDHSIGEIVGLNTDKTVGTAMLNLEKVYNQLSHYIVTSADSTPVNISIFRPKWYQGLDTKTNLTKD